ncbi:peptidoglycan-binding domain-containing protein [Streptomyces sp. MUM 203J]|uniref:peptidoglycan-binding protein n=1 Tax=Streptomyces sp. MUM 203J TaxID=2791990 RepID=UPI001F0361DE|nr:peptidoglycan-binding protein [Streptomyces sp. MUM 203J]MCH0540012.1 peptidoglycan-binding domain-containing protein [Streptomyces sp. MUM 203J]
MDLVTRAQWGAPAASPAPYLASTRGVKVHYLGTPYASRPHDRCAAHVRSVRDTHLADTAENYVDIAYSMLVCEHGTVYEGRGAHRRTGANGSRALNEAHYAVCALLGTSGLTRPPDPMLHGLRDAVEWLRTEGAAGPEIKGHRDGYPTSCPGEPLYAWVRDGAPRPSGDAGTGGAARYQTTIRGLVYGYGARGDHVTEVGRALVGKGHGAHYRVGPGPLWSDADTLNYASWQRALGYSGADADGVPGEASLRRLLGRLPSAPPQVDLDRLVAAARQDPPRSGRPVSYPGVRVVEDALVAEGLLDGTYADGHFGTATVRAYAAWQRRCGYAGPAADGIPGRDSLTRLGREHGFTVAS